MDSIVTKNLRLRFLDPVEKCLPVVKADRAAKQTCRFVIDFRAREKAILGNF
jgi:hypothetical protein